MANELSIRYYSLENVCEKEELNFVCNAIEDLLSQSHLQRIKNAFINNTRIASNGLVYLRIKGLADILRTGASNYFVYQGVDNIIAPAEIISIDGYEYISGPSLAGLLDYRISSNVGKTKAYLQYSSKIYTIIRELSGVNTIREMYIQDVETNRKEMKKLRIQELGICCCEFTGTAFEKNSEVEFAHIESVVTNPHLASDINNGVIILKSIHKELTRLNIHDFDGMYEFCIQNNYNLQWAN